MQQLFDMKIFKVLGLALMMIMSLCTQNSYAQDVQMATLQHEDELSTYYGVNAFIEAMDKAEHGDVINLSSGIFNSPYITKAVKIYGAGYSQNSATNQYETKMANDMYVDINDGAKGLLIEGLYTRWLSFKNTINNATVSRCMIDGYLGIDNAKNCLVEKYRIKDCFYAGNHSENVILDNSVVSYIESNDYDATFMIRHCIIGWLVHDTKYAHGLRSASISNSVIFSGGGTNTIQYENCVLHYELSSNIKHVGCHWVSNPLTLFENLPTFSYEQQESYRLPMDNDFILNKKEIELNKIVSSDGTEIGIHGGTSPFTSIPSNPQIVSKEIATETDEEGKLAVKIKVEAQNK